MAAFPPTYMLASVDAMRPVFLIVMGLSLLLVAWRLTRHTSGWPSRILMAGALLLALGYSVIIPLYTAKVIPSLSLIAYYPDADPALVLGFHLTKLFAMNGGWLLFGLGLALYARSFDPRSHNAVPSHSNPVLP